MTPDQAGAVMTLRATLDELFRHDALAKKAQERLLRTGHRKDLANLLADATKEALRSSNIQRLCRLCGLLPQVPSPKTAQALFGVLQYDDETARLAAGEGLVELGVLHFDLLRDGALAMLEASKDGFGISELADIIAETEHPAAVDLLIAMVKHKNPQVVSAALEVVGELCWHDKVRRALDELEGDNRSVVVEDEQEGQVTLSIAELAEGIKAALSDAAAKVRG